MADKKRLLDIWIVDLKRVYKDVPFAVIADWLQQGRLLPGDRVRPAGAGEWQPFDAVAAFEPYLPRAETLRVDDQAEALEHVDLGFHWKRPGEDEDDDVDMIPLIDISLVLLIFFMMTASVSSGFFSPINTPGARHQLASITQDMYWVGIDKKNKAGTVENGPDGRMLPWYSFGLGQKELHKPTLTLPEVVDALGQELEKLEGAVKVRLRADRDLPVDVVRETILALQGLEVRLNRNREGKGKLVLDFVAEVSEPNQ